MWPGTCVKLLLMWVERNNVAALPDDLNGVHDEFREELDLTARPLPHSLEGVPEETLSALDVQELRKLCTDRGLLKRDAQTSSAAKIHKGIFNYRVH